ncbi:MAG TPA: hypothetical protein ENN88_00425 [Candidatus Coatesbacteria bacterium]|nr:hypothetical protein [Candidatus Coatesbacteria bacterium]
MRTTTCILAALSCAAPAFEPLPWEAGQWASYEDTTGAVAATVSVVEKAEGRRLQFDLMLPGVGTLVAQLALNDDGLEVIGEEVARHLREPGARSQELPADLASLLDRYGMQGGEILLGVDSPELGDRLVLSVSPELLGEIASAFGEFDGLFPPEPPDYDVEDGVEVEVPAGGFVCRKISSGTGDAWYAEEVPLFGLVRLVIPDEQGGAGTVLELSKYGLAEAGDSLAGWPSPLPLEAFLGLMETGQGYEPYTETDALGNKKPRG